MVYVDVEGWLDGFATAVAHGGGIQHARLTYAAEDRRSVRPLPPLLLLWLRCSSLFTQIRRA